MDLGRAKISYTLLINPAMTSLIIFFFFTSFSNTFVLVIPPILFLVLDR